MPTKGGRWELQGTLGEVLESLAGDGLERREELGVAVPMATGGAARGRRRGPAHASNWVSHFIGTCVTTRPGKYRTIA
jgi:hypothetical protein